MNKFPELSAVIFDWAGTTVDYGCFAPTGVFIEVFAHKGIEITIDEARGPMGMHKRDHIKAVAGLDRIRKQWLDKFGRECTEDDIDDLYNDFIPQQLSVIERYSDIVPELPDALDVIRSADLKIGSTTGYNNEMMDLLKESAARQGYTPDSVVCATDVSRGRPAPWMAFRNAENMGVFPMHRIVKIGDTIADIKEGLNAGMWSVGVINSSNEMGLTLTEISMLDKDSLYERISKIREDFLRSGAHYVIETLLETEELLHTINERLLRGEKPV